MAVEVGSDFPLVRPPDYAWLTVCQLTAMAAFSYQVNIEARSMPLCLRALGSGAGTAL